MKDKREGSNTSLDKENVDPQLGYLGIVTLLPTVSEASTKN